MSIAVEPLGGDRWRVRVEGPPATEHEVSVAADYAAKLAPGEPVEELLRRSFEFLLEREPNTSILRRFELPVIGRYFPEYERTISRRG